MAPVPQDGADGHDHWIHIGDKEMIDPDAAKMQDILHKSYPAKRAYYDADIILGVLRYIKYLEAKLAVMLETTP